jgi:hypothetical protein
MDEAAHTVAGYSSVLQASGSNQQQPLVHPSCNSNVTNGNKQQYMPATRRVAPLAQQRLYLGAGI